MAFAAAVMELGFYSCMFLDIAAVISERIHEAPQTEEAADRHYSFKFAITAAFFIKTFPAARSHSVLKLFSGFAIAPLTACKPTVHKAISMAMVPARANIHQFRLIR